MSAPALLGLAAAALGLAAVVVALTLAGRLERERSHRDRAIIEGTVNHVLERLETGARPTASQLASEVILAVRSATRAHDRRKPFERF